MQQVDWLIMLSIIGARATLGPKNFKALNLAISTALTITPKYAHNYDVIIITMIIISITFRCGRILFISIPWNYYKGRITVIQLAAILDVGVEVVVHNGNNYFSIISDLFQNGVGLVKALILVNG